SEFQGADKLIESGATEKVNADLPTREELALLRMRRVLSEEKYEWRTIAVLAAKAAIPDAEAIEILRGDPEVEFGRSKNGHTIAKLRAIEPVAPVEMRVRFFVEIGGESSPRIVDGTRAVKNEDGDRLVVYDGKSVVGTFLGVRRWWIEPVPTT